jgi:hypothetical protein
MRIIMILLLSFSGWTAFAERFECVRQVTEVTRHVTRISLWDILEADVLVRDCQGKNGFEICFDRRTKTLANEYTLCGQYVEQAYECGINAWADKDGSEVYDTNCPRKRINARFRLYADGTGRLTCTVKGQVIESRRLGQCG